MCYNLNKYLLPNNLAKYQYFFTRDFISLLHFEKAISALHHNCFPKHSLFTTHSLLLKVGEACNISSKCWTPYKLANKIFLHKTPCTLSSFQEKTSALYRKCFLNYPLFIRYSLFLKLSEVCNFQINDESLITELTKNIYTRHLTRLLYFKKKMCYPSQNLIETSAFYHIFTSFHSEWGLIYIKWIPTSL